MSFPFVPTEAGILRVEGFVVRESSLTWTKALASTPSSNASFNSTRRPREAILNIHNYHRPPQKEAKKNAKNHSDGFHFMLSDDTSKVTFSNCATGSLVELT